MGCFNLFGVLRCGVTGRGMVDCVIELRNLPGWFPNFSFRTETQATGSFCVVLPEEAVLQMFKATSSAERDDYPVAVIVSTSSGTELWQGEKTISRSAFAEHL